MGTYDNLIWGLGCLGGGIFLWKTWETRVQNSIDSGNRVWGRLGIPQASEQTQRILGKLLYKFLGGTFILVGLLQLYSFFTGRDWPLHYAWPF